MWWLPAYASLAVGIVGIFVPGLPTAVFVLISAWAASRGSQRLHHWLLTHPRFGPAIRDWQAHGAVGRRAKWLASVTMAVSAAILWWLAPQPWMAALGHRLHGHRGHLAVVATGTAALSASPRGPLRRGRE